MRGCSVSIASAASWRSDTGLCSGAADADARLYASICSARWIVRSSATSMRSSEACRSAGLPARAAFCACTFSAGERRAQLVRGIGGEAALALERAGQAAEQAVQRVEHRRDLGRHARQRHRRQRVGLSRLDLLRELAERREAVADQQAEQQQQHRDADHERLGRGVGELPGQFGADVAALGDLDPQARPRAA